MFICSYNLSSPKTVHRFNYICSTKCFMGHTQKYRKILKVIVLAPSMTPFMIYVIIFLTTPNEMTTKLSSCEYFL